MIRQTTKKIEAALDRMRETGTKALVLEDEYGFVRDVATGDAGNTAFLEVARLERIFIQVTRMDLQDVHPDAIIRLACKLFDCIQVRGRFFQEQPLDETPRG
jgi:hypothetical protein